MGIISSEEYSLTYGRGVGNTLSEALNSASTRIWVVSPKIDEKYVNQIIEKQEGKDADVRVVTQNSKNKALKKLLETEKIESQNFLYDYRFLFLALTLLGLAGTTLSWSFNAQMIYIPVTLFAISLGLLIAAYFLNDEENKYSSKIDLHLQENLVTNSRIYILDGKVFVGSADLTEDSMWKQMEHLFQFKSSQAQEGVEDFFNKITGETTKDKERIQEMGEKLFEE